MVNKVNLLRLSSKNSMTNSKGPAIIMKYFLVRNTIIDRNLRDNLIPPGNYHYAFVASI
jgi:hypothetical protein